MGKTFTILRIEEKIPLCKDKLNSLLRIDDTSDFSTYRILKEKLCGSLIFVVFNDSMTLMISLGDVGAMNKEFSFLFLG